MKMEKGEVAFDIINNNIEEKWQRPTAYQVYHHDREMYEIVLEDGTELLVSPEHRVYGTIVDQTNPGSSSSFNSGVDTTGILFSTISLNSGSLDQILTSMPDDLYFKANAVYGKSSRGANFLASSRNPEYSSLGTGSIFLNHKCLLATAALTSLPSSLACSSVNSLSFRISRAIENCISSKNSDITLSTANPTLSSNPVGTSNFKVISPISITNNIDSEYINTNTLVEADEKDALIGIRMFSYLEMDFEGKRVRVE